MQMRRKEKERKKKKEKRQENYSILLTFAIPIYCYSRAGENKIVYLG